MLKLISFHHVFHDIRNLVRRLDKEESLTENPESNLFNLPKEMY
jgi:hypothetical protein